MKVLFFAFVLSACGVGRGGVCATSGDCAAGLVCTAGVCGSECTDCVVGASNAAQTPPQIGVSAVAPSGVLMAGNTVVVPITVTRNESANDSIVLTESGLPTGVTATFTPAALGGITLNSVMTLSASAAAVPGDFTVSIGASSTGATASTSIPLRVRATVRIHVREPDARLPTELGIPGLKVRVANAPVATTDASGVASVVIDRMPYSVDVLYGLISTIRMAGRFEGLTSREPHLVPLIGPVAASGVKFFVPGRFGPVAGTFTRRGAALWSPSFKAVSGSSVASSDFDMLFLCKTCAPNSTTYTNVEMLGFAVSPSGNASAGRGIGHFTFNTSAGPQIDYFGTAPVAYSPMTAQSYDLAISTLPGQTISNRTCGVAVDGQPALVDFISYGASGPTFIGFHSPTLTPYAKVSWTSSNPTVISSRTLPLVPGATAPVGVVPPATTTLTSTGPVGPGTNVTVTGEPGVLLLFLNTPSTYLFCTAESNSCQLPDVRDIDPLYGVPGATNAGLAAVTKTGTMANEVAPLQSPALPSINVTAIFSVSTPP